MKSLDGGTVDIPEILRQALPRISRSVARIEDGCEWTMDRILNLQLLIAHLRNACYRIEDDCEDTGVAEIKQYAESLMQWILILKVLIAHLSAEISKCDGAEKKFQDSIRSCRRYTADQGCPLHGEFCNE
jgi:hypothetical protein